MTTPGAGDDSGFWLAYGGAIVTVLATFGGVIKWLLGRIEAVRVASDGRIDQLRASNEAAIERLRLDVVGRIEGHQKQYREDHATAQKFRENMLATMVTRAEADRLLDRQTEQLLDRLDARFRPLIDDRRRAGD